MAEILSSVVIGEAVNRATSFLIAKNEATSDEDVERLEMANIKMEAALETSRRWNITDASLLRWRGMLRRAAEECEDALHICKRRSMAMDEQQQEEVQNFCLPRRIAHTTKSYISYFASYCIRKQDSQQSVRRFERFAEGASEFIRLVELGGTRRHNMFFNPLIGHLLAGNELNYEVSRGYRRQFFGIRPICFDERGVEAKLLYDYQDHKAPERNFCLGATLRLSESTDVVGVILACLQKLVVTLPHFRPTAETVMRELTQLPTQDFSCKPYVVSQDIEHWNYHSILTEWFRPNPRCCSRRDQNSQEPVHSSSTDDALDFVPESVIEVFLHRNMSICEYDAEYGGAGVHLGERPLFKMWALFTPHTASHHLRHAQDSTTDVAVVINGQQKHGSEYTGMSRQQMDELLLPKAIQYLCCNIEAKSYQLFSKSIHGMLQLSVEKIGTKMQRKAAGSNRGMRRRAGGKRNAMTLRREAKIGPWKQRRQAAVDLFKSWATTFAPDKLQGSINAWIERVDNTSSDRLAIT